MRETSSDYENVIRDLWRPAAVRKLAREMADIAAEALGPQWGAVRRPGAEQMAARIVKGNGRSRGLTAVVREIQRASLHLAHPRYIAQQVAAPIPASALVEPVVAAMNQSLAVWEMGPIAVAIDRDLMGRFKKLFGYPKEAEGSMLPGGAFGNLTALLAAREALAPGATRTGRFRIAVIAGEQTHYSIARAAAILGMGRESVYRVPLDAAFRSDAARVPEAFAAARKAGFERFILVGSAGSTPTGSFDDFPALRSIADREGAWLHVDAAHGAGLAFSRRLRRRLEGIGAADSIAFDPHKMMFMPLSAGGVLVRDGARLGQVLEEEAPYLFGSVRRWPDLGHLTIACSQRFDALKVWLPWRVYGGRVWDALVTHVCEVCRAAFRYCQRSEALAPLHEPQSNILCFELRARGGTDSDRVHWEIKERLNESGYGYVSSTVLDGRRVLRLVVMNPLTQVSDVEDVLRRIEAMAGAYRQGEGAAQKSPRGSAGGPVSQGKQK